MIFSRHFKISIGIILLAVIALIGGYEYVLHRINGTSRRVERLLAGDTRPPASVLPSNDKEQITFNEKTHTLTVQTATKTIVEYAKDPVVQISKSGVVTIQRHLTGFENEPFIGFGYSDTGRVFLGDNVYHLGRLDLVAVISWTPVNSYVAFKPYIGCGYNFYHNTSINLAVNPDIIVTRTSDIAAFLSVRF